MATFHRNRGILVDIACTTFVGLLVVCINLFTQPTKRGFFCDDESIRYPFLPQTISTGPLAAFCFTLPAFVFLVVEGFRLFDTSTPRDSWHSVSSSLLKNIYELYGIFLFGVGLMQITSDVGKYTIGRLRPHFYDACKPYPEDVCGPGKDHVYVTDYECSGDPDVVAEARLSFPSGHASLAFYSAIYTGVYLHHRLYWRRARLSRLLSQFVLLMLAWYTALSRVMDNMHHATDVLAGIAIGSIWALFMAIFAIDMRLGSNNVTKEELRSLRATPLGTPGPNQV
ncbi:putative phosphatidate phosphatase [Macrosteles quadrilineatus]|uniref:putative phosphatidate phosphatase n=1 Tax=Macrosteles quadrilineatus TaxID=74068 RepID=UPI0023E15AEB|nr:putative phosphatidate phosphatase [Macrosteles quadrilineatus]XP_054289976.1 putative phosphatidate phosphatase [Macrosteles quadrilineatus]